MGSHRVGHNWSDLAAAANAQKGKGEKERYSHLNAEFWRIARRGKKAFLSDQCKKVEKDNRLGKTRDLFKKSRDTKGNISCKDGHNKGQKWYGPNRSRDIKTRWREYTEELYKKDLHDPDNHDGVITHLEPNILECKVKWALGSINSNKASGGELFQILKDDTVKVLHSIGQQIWLEKLSFHSSPKERQCQRMLKLLHNCTHLTH